MLWEDPESEVPAFVEVAADNTSSVLEPFQKAKSASEFLQDEEVVCPLSAACCDGEMASLEFTFDIDGIVLEVRELSALNTGVNFLTMKWPPVVAPHYHFIKKHIDSAGLSGKEQRMLRHDQRFLLGILDEAIAGETENQDFQILKTLSRFGQKSEEPWYCEAANFASSLDGLAADWSAELSSVLKAPNVLFLQLFTGSFQGPSATL
ncbi:unnamed protein product [Arctogadus glacialis]